MIVRTFSFSLLPLSQPWHWYALLRSSSSHALSVLECPNFTKYPQQDHHSSYMDASQKLSDAMKDCAFIRCRLTAHALHSHLISSGYHCSIFLQNHLLHMYSSCCSLDDVCRIFSEIQSPNIFTLNTMIVAWGAGGRLLEAQKVFDEIPYRDTVSWNSLMSAYLNNGQPENTLGVFYAMIHDMVSGDSPDPFSLSYALKACGSLGSLDLALVLHCFVTRRCSFIYSDPVVSSLIDMYMKCSAFSYAARVFSRIQNPSTFCSNCMILAHSKLYGIAGAVNFFRGMSETDVVSWSTVVSLLPQHGCFVQALSAFVEMCALGFRPNSMTYSSVLSACANLCNLKWGAHLHARILRLESNLDVYTGSGLIDLYVKCGKLELGSKVFDSLEERNIVAWTSLISGVVQFGTKEEGVMLFNQMRKEQLSPDHFTMATVLGLCSSYKDLLLGMQFHGCLVKAGLEQSITVGNALITMYANSGDIQKANVAFNSMLRKDIISWTAILTAFSHCGNVEMSRYFFEMMPERNTVTWNTMMSTYVKHDLWEEGLKLYVWMLRVGVIPDQTTFAVLLSACADSTLSKLGRQIMAQVDKLGLGLDVTVTNSAITMYSKCGLIHEAQKIFDLVPVKNLVTWNALLTAYAQNGHGFKVIEIFEDMINIGNAPDNISFLSLLAGCSHAGLVREGCNYFNSMMKDHGIVPSQEHFNCMVDLLGRAGLLDQAKILIDCSAFQADVMAWGALLGASRIYSNKEFSEYAASKLMKLEAECSSGLYSLMASMHFDSGELDEVANLRKMMKDKGMKNLGCSWIEINQSVHLFTACGTSHPQMKYVLEMLVMIARDAENSTCCANNETFIDLI